jgi:nitrous oxidase accessory protein NosD
LVRPIRWGRIPGATVALVCAILPLYMSGSPGQAFANHIHCGDAITQDASLDSDLRCSEGSAIVIGADNITLNLNGYAIDDRSHQIGSPIGIDNRAGHDNVTVENGHIRGYDIGIYLDQASGNRVRDVTVARGNQTWGVFLSHSDGNEIEHVSAQSYEGPGIYLSESDRNVIRQSVGSASRFRGIGLFRSHRNRIESSRGDGGDGLGITLNESDQNLIEDSHGSAGAAGIFLAYSNRNRIRRSSGTSSGYGFDGPLDDGAGIWLDHSDANKLTQTVTGSNAFDGIHVEGSFKNLIADSFAISNRRDGIFVDGQSSATRIRSVVANRNGDDGIDVESSTTFVQGNTAKFNGDLGIEAVRGVRHGGKNTADGNGNPLQCTNVVCK